MKEWWYARDARERRLLSIGAVVVAIALLYLGVWQPVQSGLVSQQRLVKDQRDTLAWIQEQGSKVKALRATQRNSRSTNQPILSLVERTANSARIQIKRIEPSGKNQAQLWIEQAPFDKLVVWLASMQQQYGISVSTISVERQETGIVDARVVVTGADS